MRQASNSLATGQKAASHVKAAIYELKKYANISTVGRKCHKEIVSPANALQDIRKHHDTALTVRRKKLDSSASIASVLRMWRKQGDQTRTKKTAPRISGKPLVKML